MDCRLHVRQIPVLKIRGQNPWNSGTGERWSHAIIFRFLTAYSLILYRSFA